ncbi:hypothetical protein PPL_09750 [Heterostelium album PN500]|uniref:Amine oxidase domain-containing protein n=1 Tax=Heterostelium pallidum (strain ATCC 26659 / Pp 5 / PN500) TaxID=670386 RepID=D3BNP7_HETP5|nr:hypothetical protein PPL_09750 [Heterostelium album PN500]EFA76998.1 hypothetical protein PPL_09750 [Heterostelium album PN500]|eukprot:XP_020429129.1 hypothetical protein PPL_09750 [Heterostelium album PN500]
MRLLVLTVILAITVAGVLAQQQTSLRGHYANSLLNEAGAGAAPIETFSKPSRPMTVGIVGAGMSGLYAALLLEDLGISYEIVEANDRFGGRAHTFKFSSAPYDYVDFGAMRFPRTPVMDRVVGQQPWSLVNKLQSLGNPVTTGTFYLSHDNNILYHNGQYVYASDSLMGDPLHFGDQYHGGPGSAVPDCYAQITPNYWLGKAIMPFIVNLTMDFDNGYKELLKFDCYSIRNYMGEVLKDNTCTPNHTMAGYDQMAITWFETMNTGSGFFDLDSLTEGILNFYDYSGKDWYYIRGGTYQFAENMVRSIGRRKVELEKRVTKIAPGVSRLDSANVTRPTLRVSIDGERNPRVYDHVISTVPLGVLQRIDTTECGLSYKKNEAYRVLTYDRSVKVGMSFKTRWWEDPVIMKGKPIFGGQSETDLPIRGVNYPSYGINSTHSGPYTLLVAYTWGQDATRLASIQNDRSQLKKLLLENLAVLHRVDYDFLRAQLVDWEMWNWDEVEFESGSFAGFSPCQFSKYFADITKSEVNGTLHFSGEATSVHHAWIIGALNSAYRAVDQILTTEGWHNLRQKLRDNWGTIDEFASEGLTQFPVPTAAALRNAQAIMDSNMNLAIDPKRI